MNALVATVSHKIFLIHLIFNVAFFIVVENTNSRVKWASLLINLVLVGIGVGQIIYVRQLLETGYY